MVQQSMMKSQMEGYQKKMEEMKSNPMAAAQGYMPESYQK